MKCFENLIGIRGICDTNYKYYLDDYGVSLKTLSKTADSKFISGKNLALSKIKQAWSEVISDIKIGGYKANKILSNSIIGTFTENAVNHVGFNGISFELTNCSLTSFYLKKIELYVVDGGETTIKIIENGTESILFTGIIDSNSIFQLNIDSYISDDFQILVDGTNITVYESTTNLYKGDMLYYNISNINYGLRIYLQVRCYLYSYLCDYADLLVNAVIYKALALIWKEVLDSDRFNDFLNIKRGENNENAITQLAWLDSTFNLLKYDLSSKGVEAGMYQLELEKINLPIPKCNCCLECSKDSYILAIP